MTKNIYVQDSKYQFTNCEDCKFADDSEDKCKERLCVHAIGTLVDCFVPMPKLPDMDILETIFDKVLKEIAPPSCVNKILQNVIERVNGGTLIYTESYVISVSIVLYNILLLKYGLPFSYMIQGAYQEDIVNFLRNYFIK